MSFAKSSAKPRLQRLRASCDGCFLAKVKCSKARPICSRCLTCGTDCKYSPSSRAGKPRANRQTSTSNIKASIANHDIIIDEVLCSPFLFDSQAISMPLDGNNSPMFAFDTNWSIPSDSVDGSRQRSSSANTTPSLGEDTLLDTIEMGLSSSTTEFFDPSFAWTATPPNELPSPAFTTGHGMALPRSRSLGDVPHLNSFSSWFGNRHSALPFSPSTNADITSPTGFFGSSPPSDRTSSSKAPSSTCNCFTTCLQSLQALHNHSSATPSVPAFDVILTVNRKAVEGCANMLACSKCISKSGSNTTSMLLATIFEKIMSFYRTASQSNFGAMSGVETQMSIGSYQVANEDGCWLRIEILWRELRKLEELFSRFREACGVEVVEAAEGPGVHYALMGHLSQSLNFTVEVLKMHQHGFKRME